MIPKKIHYCWLSNEEMPDKLTKCLESWKNKLPDYEIIKWDLNKISLEHNLWIKQAFERKKYAFAADYIRLYALATEGGIYLDSDVEVLKSFNDLLHLPYFICKENSPQGIEAAIIGAEKNTPWVLECLKYYKDKSFIDDTGKEQTEVLPIILEKQLSKYELRYIDAPTDFKITSGTIYILPSDFFSPKSYTTKKIQITKNTYAIHHFAGSWLTTYEVVRHKIKLLLVSLFGINLVINLKKALDRKN